MKILLSSFTGLGNFVLKTPMIKKIKELYPDSTIDLVTNNDFGVLDILCGNDLINRTHLLKNNAFSEMIRVFYKLFKEKYDVLFLPFDASPFFLVISSFFISKKIVIHFYLNRKIRFFRIKLMLIIFLSFFFKKYTIVPVLQGRHEIDLNYDLLEAFYNRPMDREYETIIFCKENNEVLKRFDLQDKKYIIFQLGGSNGVYDDRSWGIENFIELTEIILNKTDYYIVIVGDKGDMEIFINPYMKKYENNSRIINTASKTSINDVVTLGINAKNTVCHDSGIMHVFDAFSIPLIALYGPSDYTRTRPLKKTSKILFSKNEFFALRYNENHSQQYVASKNINNCTMKGIKVSEVAEILNIDLSGNDQ